MKAWILIAVMAMAIMAPARATEAEEGLVKWVEEHGGQVSSRGGPLGARAGRAERLRPAGRHTGPALQAPGATLGPSLRELCRLP
jgi:hypothetical protein